MREEAENGIKIEQRGERREPDQRKRNERLRAKRGD